MTQQEIIRKHWSNPLDMNGYDKLVKKGIPKMMDEWAKEQMITLLNNISRQPIQCYSEKVRGQEPKFFLGRSYVEDLIKRIK